MKKKGCAHLPVAVAKPTFVTTKYALHHSQELLKRVNQESIAVLVPDGDGLVVIAPYWWYIMILGTDVKYAIEAMFEVSKAATAIESLKLTGVAEGYINLTTRKTAQEILDQWLPLVDTHPHATHWQAVLDELSKYWNTDHETKFLIAAFAGDRKVYLLYTDGTTRLVDMRKFLGHGLEEADLENEEHFRDCLSLMAGALVWMEVAGEVRATFSSEDLLRASVPVTEDEAKDVWIPPEGKPAFSFLIHS